MTRAELAKLSKTHFKYLALVVLPDEYDKEPSLMKYDKEIHELMEQWHKHASLIKNAHYDAGRFYEKLFFMFGIPVIILSAITGGTEVFEIVDQKIGGVISLCIAVLAGLQTFLKFSQRSERHRISGARYSSIVRSLEEAMLALAESPKTAQTSLHEIKKEMDSLANECPEIPGVYLRKYDLESLAN